MPVPTSTRDQQRRESWRSLQAAALRLVRRDGFDHVTVDDITAAAGTSRRTFFNHFASKAAALFDPDPEDADRLRALLAAADPAVPPWRSLRDVLVEFVGTHDAVIAVRRQLVADHPELDADHRHAHQHVELALEEWAAQRGLPAFDARLLAQTAAAVLTTSFAQWGADDDPAELPQWVAAGFDAVSSGFTG